MRTMFRSTRIDTQAHAQAYSANSAGDNNYKANSSKTHLSSVVLVQGLCVSPEVLCATVRPALGEVTFFLPEIRLLSLRESIAPSPT
mmetsp:Transcript_177880/g.570581  ORF Transcript_177880/g.570581 Transcript_177880/m.570581 type:complete len:87 (-) Transcript_177880:252-512(-)